MAINATVRQTAIRSGLPAWLTDDNNRINIADRLQIFADKIVEQRLIDFCSNHLDSGQDISEQIKNYMENLNKNVDSL
jgi:hypothetical protein